VSRIEDVQRGRKSYIYFYPDHLGMPRHPTFMLASELLISF